MTEVRGNEGENHGDYTYFVEETEGKVVGYRKPINGPKDAPDEQVFYEDLPSRSLKQLYMKLADAVDD